MKEKKLCAHRKITRLLTILKNDFLAFTYKSYKKYYMCNELSKVLFKKKSVLVLINC